MHEPSFSLCESSVSPPKVIILISAQTQGGMCPSSVYVTLISANKYKGK